MWWTLDESSLVTDTYTYDNSQWKDLLTAYNGQAITYDEIGNPLTYRRGEEMIWVGGRRLSEIYFDDYGDMLFFDYDSNGMRLRKYGPRVNQYCYSNLSSRIDYIDYYYDGDTLIYERRSGDGDNATERYTIEYVYGVNGIAGFRIHQDNTTTDYFYIKNMLGDVLGIVDSNGTLVAEYCYDAYGKPVMILDGNGNDVSSNYAHIANVNPIRYRGYYYDIESGFYYLNSRYYDPEIGRFINADSYVSTGQDITGFNMFSYCGNNPVSRVDSTGDSWEDICKAVDNWCKSFKKKVEKVLKPYKRSNGYYAFYDSKSTSMTKKNKFREQFVAAEISTPSVDPTEGSVGLGSINADLHKGVWELGDVKISLLEFGHFEAAAEVSKAEGLNFGFQASVWSPSVSFKVSDNIEVEIGLEVLSIGGAYSFNSQDHEFKSNNFINFEIRWCE